MHGGQDLLELVKSLSDLFHIPNVDLANFWWTCSTEARTDGLPAGIIECLEYLTAQLARRTCDKHTLRHYVLISTKHFEFDLVANNENPSTKERDHDDIMLLAENYDDIETIWD